MMAGGPICPTACFHMTLQAKDGFYIFKLSKKLKNTPCQVKIILISNFSVCR